MTPNEPPAIPRPPWERGSAPHAFHNGDCAGIIDTFGHRTDDAGQVVENGRCISRHPGGASCGWRYVRPLGGAWLALT